MRVLIFSLAVALTGCTDSPPVEQHTADQCLRAELFQSCMASLPPGPVSTQYNDWDEVVKACGSVSYKQSLRLESQVSKECR